MTQSKTGEEVFLPVYLGRCASRIGVEDIPPEVDVAWLGDAIMLGMEGRWWSFRPPEHFTGIDRDKDWTWSYRLW